jgi:hypothetical protein
MKNFLDKIGLIFGLLIILAIFGVLFVIFFKFLGTLNLYLLNININFSQAMFTFKGDIDPNKYYLWYHGFWHGIFVIPRWIFSFFDSSIYCKAPNSSFAYVICWWISFLTIGLSVSNSRKK